MFADLFPDFNGWLALIRHDWLYTLGWLLGMAAGFALLARWMPCNPGMFWWKDLRSFATDAVYWFVVPLFLRVCRTLMLLAGVVLIFQGHDPQPLPVRNLPLWQQCLLVLVFQDILLYWIHRAFHTRLGWGFHAIHHSPKVLDWTATVRFHPLNNLLAFTLADVIVLLLGFSSETLFIMAPFNILYSAMVHANLNWTFGPLRYVLASPVFHRWHHTTLREGLNKNYASTFPVLDLLFGSYYMPPGKLPEHFGNDEPDFPRSFWGQFVHPFWNRATILGAWVRRRPAAALLVVGLMVAAGLMLDRWIKQTTELLQQNARLKQEVAQVQQQQAEQVETLTRPVRPTALMGVAVSADASRIASCSTDGTVKVWDRHGQLKQTLVGHDRPVRCVAISSDGRWIVSGSFDWTLKVWDAETGREVRTLRGHAGSVLAVAISADGRTIVSGSGDFSGRLWNLNTGQEEMALPGPPGAVVSVAISADSRRVVTTSGMNVRVWDRVSGSAKTLEGHEDHVNSVAISADGRRVVSASLDGTAIIWDVDKGRPRRILRGHAGPVYGVAIDKDGTTIVSGGADGTVRIWDAATGRLVRTLTGHANAVMSVALDGEGRIVTGSRDGTVKVWPADRGNPLKLTHQTGAEIHVAAAK